MVTSGVAQATTLANGTDLPFGSLALWLKADSGLAQVYANPPVDLWADQSGNGNNATQPSSINLTLWLAGALNGRRVVRFDGVNSYLNLPNFMSDATSGEGFVVLKSTTPSGSQGSLWSQEVIRFILDTIVHRDIQIPMGALLRILEVRIPCIFTVWESRRNRSISITCIMSHRRTPTGRRGLMETLLYQTTNNTVGFINGSSALGACFWHFAGDIAEVLVFKRPPVPMNVRLSTAI